MSISVDDLVSSFSSSHIGQEAMDLAQLQAQLAETLFNGNSFASSSRRGRDYQACPTPTARTPSSSSFNWESIDAFAGQSRSRSSSISGRMEDVEDELMVEELLMGQPSSPAFENGNHNSFSSFSSAGSYVQPSSSFATSYHPSAQSSSRPEPTPSSPSQSLFASTDPFFLQAQANSQSYFYNNSNVTQRGRPSQSSPFVQSPSAFGHGYHNHFQSATAAAF